MAFSEVLSYGFMVRALAGGVLIGCLCAVLGVFLVLRRLSLIGDGLAHVTFGSVAVALLCRVSPLYVTVASVPLVLLASLGILKLSERARLFGDAAIGIVSAAGIAGGVILASVAGGFNIDLFSYLFGNILSISMPDLVTAAILFVIVLAVVLLFYQELFAITFDEELARSSGVRVERFNALLVLLTGVTVVLAMKVVGIMLISALLILPAATALQLTCGFRGTLLASCGSSVVAVIGGIFSSLFFNLPTGATIVALSLVQFLLAMSFRRGIGLRSSR